MAKNAMLLVFALLHTVAAGGEPLIPEGTEAAQIESEITAMQHTIDQQGLCTLGSDAPRRMGRMQFSLLQSQGKVGDKGNDKVVPVSWTNQKSGQKTDFWDGKLSSKLPASVPKGFSAAGNPKNGKYAYLTMLTPGDADDGYQCMALSLFTSLEKTGSRGDIDRVIAVLQPDDRQQYKGVSGKWKMEDLPQVLGQDFYDAYKGLGVRFIIWSELDTKDRILSGWRYAFSKLQVFGLTDYERVTFLDADTMALQNLDHLFDIDDTEFVSAGTWNCMGLGGYTPSGGFWVVQPSTDVWGLMQTYLAGQDPCGMKWYQGDMTILRYMFMGARTWGDPDLNIGHGIPKASWPTYDGDITQFTNHKDDPPRSTRCDSFNLLWPHRADEVFKADGSSKVAPDSVWHMLPETYDMLVGPCDSDNFANNEGDDRYRKKAGAGKTGWGRPDAHSVHFSCGEVKPQCHMPGSFMEKLPPCQRSMFEKWYEHLNSHTFMDKRNKAKSSGKAEESVLVEGVFDRAAPEPAAPVAVEPEKHPVSGKVLMECQSAVSVGTCSERHMCKWENGVCLQGSEETQTGPGRANQAQVEVPLNIDDSVEPKASVSGITLSADTAKPAVMDTDTAKAIMHDTICNDPNGCMMHSDVKIMS